jgi:small subunit ribosomal protein S3
MGQKVHPISFRLGYIKTWGSRWYARKGDFAKFLHEDIKVRKHVTKTFAQAAIAKVEIERASDKIRVFVHTARPGVIIGRKGADIDRLREDLTSITGNKEIHINIVEIKNPSVNAQLIAENIALQLEKRIAFRRAMKKAIQQAFDQGAKGVKIQTKGRLAGGEIARSEGYLEGSVPLHTLRADIDFGFHEANTTYGKIGVKVLVYRGDILKGTKMEKKEELVAIPVEKAASVIPMTETPNVTPDA